MTHNRRPLSLAMSVALGLGAVLLVLFAGGPPAAAAPAPAGLNPPLPSNCYARNDSATLLVYSSADSAAVRQAELAALPNDTLRLAGTCAGVAAQGGTTQTVLINKALTLVGGYTPTNWINSFPITQPTTLDAQSQGRVITASASITVANLTVQHGRSFGGNGGGIYAGGHLALIGKVGILLNSTLPSGLDRAGAPARSSGAPGGGDGGGAWGAADALLAASYGNLGDPTFALVFLSNSAGGFGGGLKVDGDANVDDTTFSNNLADFYGGGGAISGTLQANDDVFGYNHAFNGGGLYTFLGVNMQNIMFIHNIADNGGGGWAGISFQSATGSHLTFTDNTAKFGGAADIFQLAAAISDSYFGNNQASTAGGALYFADSSGKVFNSVLLNNIAPEGAALATTRLLAPDPPRDEIMDLLAATGLFNTRDAASASTPASTAVLTGSAFASTGASLFITDTIVSGYALNLETGSAPSSTIHGDYNLFDQTPVISGTNITTGTHSLVGNPLFADAQGHLSAGSPAIDHGTDVGINVDYDGNHRPSGAGFDIGPYEFVFVRLFLPLLQR